MRKVVDVRLWVEDEDEESLTDESLRDDIQVELNYCWHDFNIIGFETMEIANEKAYV